MDSPSVSHARSRKHRGISAWSQPAEEVNPDAVRSIAEVGIDISGARPKRLTTDIMEEADIVVTMGCDKDVCPIMPKEITSGTSRTHRESPSRE